MCSGKFLSRAGRLGYDIILKDTVNPPAENVEAKTKYDSILKQLNKNAYNELI